MLALLKIPPAMLPRVVASSGVAAETAPQVFNAVVPITGIAGDQQAALFGQRCCTPGMVKNTYGTGCFMVMHTGRNTVASRHKLLTTTAWRMGATDEFALEGSVFVAGAAVQWLRDGLGVIKTSAEVEALAATVADNGGVYLVPAFTGLGAPHWDAYARGSKASHIARATLESIAYQVAGVLEAMQVDAG